MIEQLSFLLLVLLGGSPIVESLNIVVPGGTGPLAKELFPLLSSHKITALSRNAFLAATPSRVSSDFGHLGANFLSQNPHVSLRDWDGGDLLDIVGQDWVGWQEDTLPQADVILNLVGGGYTEQRVMATERLARESLTSAPSDVAFVTVSPTEEDIKIHSKGMYPTKLKRLKLCEDMVTQNCPGQTYCLRCEMFDVPGVCHKNCQVIEEIENSKK